MIPAPSASFGSSRLMCSRRRGRTGAAGRSRRYRPRAAATPSAVARVHPRVTGAGLAWGVRPTGRVPARRADAEVARYALVPRAVERRREILASPGDRPDPGVIGFPHTAMKVTHD